MIATSTMSSAKSAPSSELPSIDFEGTIVSPKKGVYRCPFRCHGSYPVKTWKTEAGFRRHMMQCARSPSAIKRAQDDTEMQRIEYERHKAAVLSRATQQVGDEVWWVQEVILKGEYEYRGARRVRVRYEPIKKFVARSDKIESINVDGFGGVYFNHHALMFTPSTICATRDDAESKAVEKQRKWDEWCAEAERCR